MTAVSRERISAYLRCSTCLLSLVVLCFAGVAAQTTGKLTGLVTDANTGEPLIGANVIVSGTTTGISSGTDGSFLLLGAPVGTYDIEVSYVGYETKIVEGVEINAGYTRELNVVLEPGVEFERVVVEYERPLIQKDAVGVPRFVTSEEIINLPVRGVESVAAIQAGVVNIPGREELFVRGGRSRDVAVFVDGVRVIPDRENGLGVIGVPQSAIQEQEMQIGNISARYGDVMSGVVNIVTKSGASKWFGSLEGMGSLGLDDYGSNLVSGSIGGPLLGNRLSVFASGEFVRADDGSPRAVEMLRVDEDELARLEQNPQAIRVIHPDSSSEYVELPGSIAHGAAIPLDENGNVIVGEDGTILLSDGSVVQIPPGSRTSLNPVHGAEAVDPSVFEPHKARLGNERRVASGTANLTFRPYETGRLRVGGRLASTRTQSLTSTEWLFAPDAYDQTDDDQWQAFGAYTHYFSGSSLLQFQFDYSDRQSVTYDHRFGSDVENTILYGDLDTPERAVAARYKGIDEVDSQRVYVPLFEDGVIFSSSIVWLPGEHFSEYEQFHHQQWRLSGVASAQVGVHQLEIGAEFEQGTKRRWRLPRFEAHALAIYIDDSETCSVGECGPGLRIDSDGDGQFDSITSYSDLPQQVLGARGYGYDRLGLSEVSEMDFAGLVNNTSTDVEPWRPRFYGGYVQDKIEYDDLVLNLGLRVDVFDNNTIVFQDPYARVPIVRAGDVSSTPASIAPDYAVYFSGDEIVGYRDNEGNFYDLNGQVADANDVFLRGTPRAVDFGGDEALRASVWEEEVFEDYKPHVNWMPRIGASFPITDRGLVYGSYGVVSQRPLVWNFPDIALLLETGPFTALPNTALIPETTVDYEIGYRHRISSRSAVTVSGFFKQLKNMEAFRTIEFAFPGWYTTMENEDFGSVKGFEFDFQLRRTNNLSVSANYTLSFADGTGSDAFSNTSNNRIFTFEESKTVFPLDFDTRHALNGVFDLRYGAGQGPLIGSMRILEHFGLNVLIQAATGLPYTARAFQGDLRLVGEAQGSKNSSRMPSTGRVNLRADRRIPIGDQASLTVFAWIINLFDWQNYYDVHLATGQPDEDGFFLTPEGQQWLSGQLRPETAETLYNHDVTDPEWYGVPRQVQIGVRVTF